MDEKTLGQVARDAWYKLRPSCPDDWQAVADAVLAAAEARRWKAIETAPKDGTEILVGKRRSGEWTCKRTVFVAVAIEDEYTHWSPIPAAPKEVE